MKQIAMRWICLLLLFTGCGLLFGQQTRMEKVSRLYDSLIVHEIENPKTVLAMAIFETGWMECHHCTYRENNLFGFRNNSGYVRFASISDCLDFAKHWQDKYYTPWKKKHPRGTYYDFIRHMKYAYDMANYIRVIKPLEKWVGENVEAAR